MNSSNETQISTYVLQYSLQEIEEAFVNQRSLVSELEADIRRQYEKTLEALCEAGSAKAELKVQKEETARLKISLEECQHECRDIEEMMKTIGEENEELERLIKQEQIAADLDTIKYKEEMSEIIEKFRQIADIYDEEKMTRRTEEANNLLSDLLVEKESLEEEREQLKSTLENMKLEIPENICEIMGEKELEKKLQDLQKLHAELLRNAKN